MVLEEGMRSNRKLETTAQSKRIRKCELLTYSVRFCFGLIHSHPAPRGASCATLVTTRRAHEVGGLKIGLVRMV